MKSLTEGAALYVRRWKRYVRDLGPAGGGVSMKRVVTAGIPRPRTLIHPGRFNPVRIQSHHSAKGQACATGVSCPA